MFSFKHLGSTTKLCFNKALFTRLCDDNFQSVQGNLLSVRMHVELPPKAFNGCLHEKAQLWRKVSISWPLCFEKYLDIKCARIRCEVMSVDKHLLTQALPKLLNKTGKFKNDYA